MATEANTLTAAVRTARAKAHIVKTSEPTLLTELRARAAHALANMEFPNAKSEAWKYANLRALHDPACFAAIDTVRIGAAPAPRFAARQHIALHDGELLTHHVDEAALTQIADHPGAATVDWDALMSRAADEPFALLNAATAPTPLHIAVAANHAAGVVRISYSTRAASTRTASTRTASTRPTPTRTAGQFHVATRVGVSLAANSSLTLIEEITPAAGLHNAVTDIDIGPGATLRHIRWQQALGSAMSIARVIVRVASGGRYIAHQQLDSGALLRDELDIALQGADARAELSGACCVGGRDQANLLVRTRHEAPHTTSTAHYRGLADDHGRFAFNGRIHILPGAYNVDATLTNKNLLLSRDAEIDTKPELEIYADDVRCSHGATVGQLDANALFYLQSRGIDAAAASVLLRRGFALSALSSLANSVEGEVLTQLLLEQLAKLS